MKEFQMENTKYVTLESTDHLLWRKIPIKLQQKVHKFYLKHDYAIKSLIELYLVLTLKSGAKIYFLTVKSRNRLLFACQKLLLGSFFKSPGELTLPIKASSSSCCSPGKTYPGWYMTDNDVCTAHDLRQYILSFIWNTKIWMIQTTLD